MSWESVLKRMGTMIKNKIDKVMSDGVPRTGSELIAVLEGLKFRYTPTHSQASQYMSSNPKYEVVDTVQNFNRNKQINVYQIKEEFRND